jgi:hypothetical protein
VGCEAPFLAEPYCGSEPTLRTKAKLLLTISAACPSFFDGSSSWISLTRSAPVAECTTPLSGMTSGTRNFVGVFDVFAIAAERFGHLVEARIAKIPAGLIALWVSGLAPV